jgi:hypothetical protein
MEELVKKCMCKNSSLVAATPSMNMYFTKTFFFVFNSPPQLFMVEDAKWPSAENFLLIKCGSSNELLRFCSCEERSF